jgi:hypothetical protein
MSSLVSTWAGFPGPGRSRDCRSAVQGDHPPSPAQTAAPEPIRLPTGGKSSNRRNLIASLIRGLCLFRANHGFRRGPTRSTSCMPSMCGEFTPPCTPSCGHTTAQVKGAAGDRGVGWREVACSAVSGKSLARPCTAVHGMDAGAIVRSPATSDWHLSCIAVLRRPGSRVLRKVMRQRRVRQSWARSSDMTADVAYGAAWSLQVQIKAPSREWLGAQGGSYGRQSGTRRGV